MVFDKPLDTINHAGDVFVDLAERITHGASGFDGLLHTLEDGFGEVLAPAVGLDDAFERLSQLDPVLLSEEDGVDERIGGKRGVAVFQLDGACCVLPVAETLEDEVHDWQDIVDASLKREVSRESFAAPKYVASDRVDEHQAHGPCGYCS